jgi:hypothetical protein
MINVQLFLESAGIGTIFSVIDSLRRINLW